MLFRTSCGHVTRHRNSRVRREADAACKPLRRGYKVVTAICCKSSKNFTNTPKKRRIFLFQSPWRLCRTKGVVAGATRKQAAVMWAPGESIGSRAGVRMGRDHAGSCGTKQEPGGTTRSRIGRCGDRTEHVQAGEGAAERFAGEVRAGAFPAEKGVSGGK